MKMCWYSTYDSYYICTWIKNVIVSLSKKIYFLTLLTLFIIQWNGADGYSLHIESITISFSLGLLSWMSNNVFAIRDMVSETSSIWG